MAKNSLAGMYRAQMADALTGELNERLAVEITPETLATNKALVIEYMATHGETINEAIEREIRAAGKTVPDFEMVMREVVPMLLAYARERLRENPPALYPTRPS